MAEGRQHLISRVAPARDAHLWLSAFEASANRSATLFLIGIRDLKQINDLHGREAGNEVIAEVGRRIANIAIDLPGIILVSRLPGREFLLISGHSSEHPSIDYGVKKILSAVAGNLGSGIQEIHISPRIGVATASLGQTGDALLQRARAALSQAYARKGKKYVVASVDSESKIELEAQLDRSLRSAIKDRQIMILLQPQFFVSDGRLLGAEALARWHHPELGEIGAEHLFAAADRCDLREELSNYIQEDAISIAAKWPVALSDLRLSINLGAEELTEGYAYRLCELLSVSGFEPSRLTLELTEESLVRDIELAAMQLENLRRRNIRVALDDFGTGYSSLAYLKTLPLDYLKLDKGMTPDITGQGKDRVVLRAIIAMSRALGLQVIAEGVEREAELQMLRAEGCDYFQGFLKSPPLDPETFTNFAMRNG